MTGERHDGFYVGYVDETPAGVSRFARRVAIGLVLLAAALGASLALLLERFDEGVFEYGLVRDYEGELLVDPHPRLLTVDGPASGYLLVAEGKHGLEAVEAPELLPGEPASAVTASVRGTLIRNPEAAMIEVHSLELPEGAARTGAAAEPGAFAGAAADPVNDPAATSADNTPAGDSESLGPESAANPAPGATTIVTRVRGHTLLGEIVDTKCYLGAMKPGRGKAHRDCASLCIRGGIPAALLVRTEGGERRLVHLLNRQGQPLGRELLEWVGEPVEVWGTLRRRDNRLFLRTITIRPTRAPAPSVVLPSRTTPAPTASVTPVGAAARALPSGQSRPESTR